MKLERFFENFELFADAPNAVAKIRELVLDLAIQGGLVPHLPNEAPVPYESVEDATPINVSEIPSNWRIVLLADAIKTRSGNSKLIKGKLHKESAADRFQGFSASGADVWCDDYEHEGEAIIISAVGARCGKAFKATGKWSAIANTNIARPEPALFDFSFAYLVLNNEHFWVRGGSAQPFVKFPPSLDRHFALPPLAEQKRIVAKVDELMALCDRLDAQQQERDTRHAALARASIARFAEAPTPANLDFLFSPSYTITSADLRKSILTLAVQGKLVPQDPNDEPADQLLDDIAKQRAKLIGADSLRKSKTCRQFSSDEAPHEIPDTWVWTMLGEITDIGTGSTPSRTEASFWMNGSIPWVTSGSTSTSPIIEGDEFVTESAVKAHRLRVYQPGTLLVAMYGQGKTRGQVALLGISATINQACAAISALEGIAPMQGYLKLLLEKQYDEMRLLSAGGAQPNLNVQKIKEVFVPLPPLAEQRRIVAKVDQLMALAGQLETQLAASRATAENLMAAVVAELTALD